MLRCGDDVSGFVDHTNYMSEMAKSGIYTPAALVAYDEGMLERARIWGPVAFTGADTHLSNSKLGVAGTVAASSQASSRGKSVVKNGSGQKAGWGASKNRSYGAGSKGLVGWRKVAADKGVCFKSSQNMVCEGCSFKHVCLNCDVPAHSMFDCPNRDKYAGDNRG